VLKRVRAACCARRASGYAPHQLGEAAAEGTPCAPRGRFAAASRGLSMRRQRRSREAAYRPASRSHAFCVSSSRGAAQVAPVRGKPFSERPLRALRPASPPPRLRRAPAGRS
jgi:hypothetical protein